MNPGSPNELSTNRRETFFLDSRLYPVQGWGVWYHGGMPNESNSESILPGGRKNGEKAADWFLRVFSLGWVPACGGTETWTLYPDGVERLYVVDMAAQQTGWLDRNDIVSPTLPTF